MIMNEVKGSDHQFDIKLWTLSTCGWCKKMKELLNELDVTYYYVDVDLLDMQDKITTKEELRRYNPRTSYPTIVINEQPIIGYDKEQILLKLQR